MVGFVENVTPVPAQIVLPGLAPILTDGTTDPVIIIVISFDVAVVGLAQARDDVITTVTISPFSHVAF